MKLLSLSLALVVAIGLATHTILTKWTQPGKDAAVAKLHEEIVSLDEKLEAPESDALAADAAAPDSEQLSPEELRKRWWELFKTLGIRTYAAFPKKPRAFDVFLEESHMKSEEDPRESPMWTFLEENRDLANAMCELVGQPVPPLAIESGLEILNRPARPRSMVEWWDFLFRVYSGSRFLRAQAFAAAFDGRRQDALRFLITACRVDAVVNDWSTAESLAGWNLSLGYSFAFLSEPDSVSDSDLQPLLDALMATHQDGFVSQWAAWQSVEMAIFQRGLPETTKTEGPFTYVMAWHLYDAFGGPLVNTDIQRGMALLSEFNAIAETTPLHEIAGLGQSYLEQGVALPIHSEFTRRSLNSILYTTWAMGESRATHDTTALGILIQREHEKTGSYPESLDFAFDILGQDSLIDPFTGTPYCYVRFDETTLHDFAVYSVGPNREDDQFDEDDTGWISPPRTATE